MKFNIDAVIGQSLHRPRDKRTKQALYLRVGEQGNVYSSPTNIRGVVIGGTITVTKTWINPVGTSTNIFTGTPTVNGKDETYTLAEVKEMVLEYSAKRQQYLQMKANGMLDAEEPEAITISGRGLKSLINPLVCNNIETIIFTSDTLISQNALSYDPIKMLLSASSRGVANNLSPSDTLKVFSYAIGIDVNNVQERLPLLKKVVYIDSLDKLVDIDRKKAEYLLSNKFDSESLSRLQQSMGGSLGTVGYCELKPKSDRLDIRDGIYELDEKLRGIRVASIKEDNDTKEEMPKASNDELKEAKIIENTIINGIGNSENEQEKTARLMFYKMALNRDYGKEKTNNIIALFKDEELRENISNV